MLCEKCKVRDANVLYTEIIDGKKEEHHFCTTCAKELDFGQYSSIFDKDFPLAKIISGIFGERQTDSVQAEYQKVVCPTCKTTYQDFIDHSKFGCGDCYEVFDVLIADRIKQIQGSDTHIGKVPSKYGKKRKILPKSVLEVGDLGENKDKEKDEALELKSKLKAAIEIEDYESAAKYRDKIRMLEGDRSHVV